MAGELGRGRALAASGDRVDRRRARVRHGLGDAPRLRPDDGLDRRRRHVGTPAGAGCCRRARRGGRSLTDDSQLVERGRQPAEPRAAADRRPARPPVRLHRAHRPDQLPRPRAARPARVGLGHDAGRSSSCSRSARSASARCSAAPTSSSTRSRSSAARRARPRPRRRSTSGSSRRPRATYQVKVPGRRAPRVADQRRHLRRRRTGAGLDVLAGRPVPRPRPAVGFGSLRTIRAETALAVPLIDADLRLEDGRSPGRSRTPRPDAREAGARARANVASARRTSRRARRPSQRSRSQPNQFGNSLSDRVVGPMFVRRREPRRGRQQRASSAARSSTS